MSHLSRMAVFAIVAGVVMTGLHAWLYLRLVHETTRDRRLRLVGKMAVVALTVALVSARFVYAHLPHSVRVPYATTTWLWMGLATYMVLTFLVVGTARRLFQLGSWLWRKAQKERALPLVPVDEGRRLLVSRALGGSALALSSGFVGFGAARCFEPPVLTEVPLKLPGLPKTLDGFSIVQLTDVHVGGILEQRFVRGLVRRCNELAPDLVVITGDLVDGDVATLGPAISEFRGLTPRHGTYFCTGNHEYYSGVDEWTSALPAMGVEPLRNRFVSIGGAGGSFDLIGVDDWGHGQRGGYDIEAATLGRDPARPAVLLAHQPRNFAGAVKKGVGLQLSGHTHGGQFFPGPWIVPLIFRYPAGHAMLGDSHIFVSRGTGFWGPPLRLGTHAEIVRITLLA